MPLTPSDAGFLSFLNDTSGPTLASASGAGATLSYTFPADTTHTIQLIFDGTAGNQYNVTCTAGSAGSSSSAARQVVSNAQTGIIYGQQTLQSFTGWIAKGVMAGFDVGPSGNPGRYVTGSTLAAAPSAEQKVVMAATRLRELTEERAELRLRNDRTIAAIDSDREKDLDEQIALARRTLTFERLHAAIVSQGVPMRLASAASSTLDDGRSTNASVLKAQQAKAASLNNGPTSGVATDQDNGVGGPTATSSAISQGFSLKRSDLVGACDFSCDTPFQQAQWNVWGEGRFTGATDSTSQLSAFGFVGSAGGDYKLTPWLALGLSVGVENFRTIYASNSTASRSTGISAVPYVGIRLHDNFYLSGFVGLTNLTYDNTPATNVTARFQGLRLFTGASLTGIWRDGPWRFQPDISGAVAWENQYGYTDSAGTAVPGQTINYGRVSAGPEIGYTLKSQVSTASIEPFVTLRMNVDFASNTTGLLNGQPIVVGSGPLASGSSGLGVVMHFDNGFYLRALGTYDSIGVSGLDVWTALLRGGYRF